MTIDRMIELLKIEHECILRNTHGDCDRRCEDCELVQDDGELHEMYENVIGLIESMEPVKPNGEQYQCNKCKFYQGVHNIRGHAPCSFWNIGGVMWNDYCSRFYDFRIGGEVG